MSIWIWENVAQDRTGHNFRESICRNVFRADKIDVFNPIAAVEVFDNLNVDHGSLLSSEGDCHNHIE